MKVEGSAAIFVALVLVLQISSIYLRQLIVNGNKGYYHSDPLNKKKYQTLFQS